MVNVVEICQLTDDIKKLKSQQINVDKYLIGPDGCKISVGQK